MSKETARETNTGVMGGRRGGGMERGGGGDGGRLGIERKRMEDAFYGNRVTKRVHCRLLSTESFSQEPQ